jgi:protein-S-isoprenylcysteine O-methyltransferase Ste14
VSKLPALGPRGEGWVALQFACLAMIGWTGATSPGAPAAPLDGMTFAIGVVLVVAGVAVAAAATLELRRGSALTPMPMPLPASDLIVTGPYALVRHPIYAGLLLGSLGWAVLRASVAAVLATVVLAFILDVKRRREEAWLAARFPDYEAYRRRTAALIPHIY